MTDDETVPVTSVFDWEDEPALEPAPRVNQPPEPC